jgi:hypothetical protein
MLGLADVHCGATLSVAGTALRITACEPSSRKLLTEGGLAAELGLPTRTPEGAGWPGSDEEPWAL